MSTSPINNALLDTKPRYTQIKLCSSPLQETRDTQISQKLIQLSHNHEDHEDSSKPRTPSYKLVFKKGTVVKVEHNFVWTEGSYSVPKSNSSDTNICPKVLQGTCVNPIMTIHVK